MSTLKEDIIRIAEKVGLELDPLPDVTVGYLRLQLADKPDPGKFLIQKFSMLRMLLEQFEWKYLYSPGNPYELYPWVLDLIMRYELPEGGVFSVDDFITSLGETYNNIYPEQNTLPVKIILDGVDRTYAMSECYAAGVYQGALSFGVDINMRMYGEKYEREYLDPHLNMTSLFSFKLRGELIQFDGVDFIEGVRFITNRLGYDADAYITDFIRDDIK